MCLNADLQNQNLSKLLKNKKQVSAEDIMRSTALGASDGATPPVGNDDSFGGPGPEFGPWLEKASILVVDDEPDIRQVVGDILQDEGYVVNVAANAAEARDQFTQVQPDLVLLDIWMPEEDGISLLKDWTKQAESDFPVIMISGHATIETAIKATKLGAKDFIEKPVSIEKLLSSAEEVLSRNTIGEDVFTHLVQNTPTLIKTLESFETIVQQKKIFLIQSEEGLEKTAWARAIHSKYFSGDAEFKELESSQKEAHQKQKKNN